MYVSKLRYSEKGELIMPSTSSLNRFSGLGKPTFQVGFHKICLGAADKDSAVAYDAMRDRVKNFYRKVANVRDFYTVDLKETSRYLDDGRTAWIYTIIYVIEPAHLNPLARV